MTRILIVDDSPTQLNGLSKVLAKNGYDIITADDGEQGVEKAVSEKPDIILMDVVMPNLNGFQATRQITRNPQTSHIPVIMLTSKDQETDKIWGMRQGARDYIVKPASERDLIDRINKVLGFDRADHKPDRADRSRVLGHLDPGENCDPGNASGDGACPTSWERPVPRSYSTPTCLSPIQVRSPRTKR